jgi:hypothetical protein
MSIFEVAAPAQCPLLASPPPAKVLSGVRFMAARIRIATTARARTRETVAGDYLQPEADEQDGQNRRADSQTLQGQISVVFMRRIARSHHKDQTVEQAGRHLESTSRGQLRR